MADEPTRLWIDKSGKFEVKASLVSQDKDKVTLLKADGKVIKVPINLLSSGDQRYLKELATKAAEAENPFAGGVPMKDVPGTPFEPQVSDPPVAEPVATPPGLARDAASAKELPAAGKEIFLSVDAPLPAVEPDPLPFSDSIRSWAKPLEKLDAYARMSEPVLVDPSRSVFAVSVHREGNAVSPAHFGRIYAVDPASQQPQPVWDEIETVILFDHHPASDRSVVALGAQAGTNRGGDIGLLQGLGNGKPSVVARWHVPEWQRPGFAPKIEFARLLDKEHVLARVNDKTYLWSLETGELSFFLATSGKICLSGGGRYLAIPKSGGCHVVDVRNQELLGFIGFPSTLTPEVSFSANGQQIVLVGGNQYVVWDLGKATVNQEVTMTAHAGKLMGWVGSQFVLTQFALIDLSLRQPIWSYSLPSGGSELTLPGGVVVTTKGSYKDPAMLMSLSVPHPPALQAKNQLENIDPSMLALSPGSSVALGITAPNGVDQAVMREALKTAVERAGWKVVPSAEVTVQAIIERGEKKELKFRSMGSSMFSQGEVAAIKPFKASLKIDRGGKTLWHRSSENMVPFLLRLEKGETVQQAVKRYEKPDPEFFARVTIPPRIFKPEFAGTVGRSRVDNGRWKD